MAAKKTNKRPTKPAHRSSSELAPASWVAELEAAHRQLEEFHGSFGKARNCPHCHKIALVVKNLMIEATTERSRSATDTR